MSAFASRPLPSLLQAQATQISERLAVSSPEELCALALSDFMSENFITHPEWWQQLHDTPPTPNEDYGCFADICWRVFHGCNRLICVKRAIRCAN